MINKLLDIRFVFKLFNCCKKYYYSPFSVIHFKFAIESRYLEEVSCKLLLPLPVYHFKIVSFCLQLRGKPLMFFSFLSPLTLQEISKFLRNNDIPFLCKRELSYIIQRNVLRSTYSKFQKVGKNNFFNSIRKEVDNAI